MSQSRLSGRGRPGLGLWWAFIAFLTVSLGVLLLGPVRLGGSLMAIAFFAAAVVRAVRPEGSGGLQVRTAAFDVVMFAGLGLMLLFAVFAVNLDARV